jgi:hypothetical protein
MLGMSRQQPLAASLGRVLWDISSFGSTPAPGTAGASWWREQQPQPLLQRQRGGALASGNSAACS